MSPTRAAEIISRIGLLFNKGSPRRELVDINPVIREMILLLRSEAVRYDISVRTELAANVPENEQLLVSVSDTGVGLPSQQADQIFKGFFTAKPHGTGSEAHQ